jgi:predicted GIY-YIG superfamily endonuclease
MPSGWRGSGWVTGTTTHPQRRLSMSVMDETGEITGTRDRVYDIIWFTERSLNNALRLETYIKDAERDGDQELADFFRKAQSESKKGGEMGKQLLASRLGK